MTTQFIKADKPRTFDRVEDRTIQTPIGNYVLITNIKGLPDISTFETLQLRDQRLMTKIVRLQTKPNFDRLRPEVLVNSIDLINEIK